jgi:hypothetical protein
MFALGFQTPIRFVLLKSFGTFALLVTLASCCNCKTPPANALLSDFRQEIGAPAPPAKMAAGQTFLLRDVTVKNTGQQTWTASSKTQVELTYNWMTPDGKLAEHGVVTTLPADVPPGQSLSVVATITAPEKPGNYVIRFTMIAEGIAWFSDMGGQTVEYPVSVVPQ